MRRSDEIAAQPASPVNASRCHRSRFSPALYADPGAGRPGITAASASKMGDKSCQLR
jgi:hypothetical protein